MPEKPDKNMAMSGKALYGGRYLLDASGGLALLFLGLQVVTGMLLMFHYEPDPARAWASVRYIQSHVSGGWFLRNLHGVSSSMLVAWSIVHLLKVFYKRLYVGRRRVHWLSGAIALFLLIGVAFSGYCLPWSQRAYWGYTIVVRAFESLPIFGSWLGDMLGSASQLGAPALRRLLAFHVGVPTLVMFALGVHFLKKPQIKNWPRDWGKASLAGIFASWLALALVFFWPEPFVSHSPAANPLLTPAAVKPEWMFTASYEILRLVPGRSGGLILMLLATLAFWFLPWLDRSGPGKIRLRRKLFLGSLAVIILMTVLTVWGFYI